MRKIIGLIAAVFTVAAIGGYWVFALPEVGNMSLSMSESNVQRGEYLVHASGCISCHKGVASEGLSGGMALESEFGTFFAPNITPDEATGIGQWQAQDFLLAMRHGRSPEGNFYFPAFPYRAYADMESQDVLDIASYLLSQDAVSVEIPNHETPFWLRRWMLGAWNKLADLLEGEAVALESSNPQALRGAYLARSLAHCGECHTPRNSIGIVQLGKEFAGATMGESHADAIDSEALEHWSEEDFAFFLLLGMKPDGEFVGGEMGSVIEHNTSTLTDEDRRALAAFFKSERK